MTQERLKGALLSRMRPTPRPLDDDRGHNRSKHPANAAITIGSTQPGSRLSFLVSDRLDADDRRN
jgi:hypothetical protein